MSELHKLRKGLRNGMHEGAAIEYFRDLIRVWRGYFTEDNWPSTADHLHELLHLAIIAEGANAQWIAFLAQTDWRTEAPEPSHDR